MGIQVMAHVSTLSMKEIPAASGSILAPIGPAPGGVRIRRSIQHPEGGAGPEINVIGARTDCAPNSVAVSGPRRGLAAEDLGKRRAADLELLGTRLTRGEQALHLVAGL